MVLTEHTHVLILPWPPKELSPNFRGHWSKKARAAKRYRHASYMASLEAKFVIPKTDGKLHLWIDFHPPSNRRIDDDNCLTRFKPLRDGIADYLGVDDCRFVSHPLVKEAVKGGKVIVRITKGIDEQGN